MDDLSRTGFLVAAQELLRSALSSMECHFLALVLIIRFSDQSSRSSLVVEVSAWALDEAANLIQHLSKGSARMCCWITKLS